MDQDSDVVEFSNGEIRIWLEADTAIHIKAVTTYGDPVELNALEAKTLAQELLRLASELEEGE